MTERLQAQAEAIDRLTALGKGASEIARELQIGRAAIHRRWKRLERQGMRRPRARTDPLYTCDECQRDLEGAGEAYLTCPYCRGLAYPPMSDAEAYRRIAQLVERLEIESDEAGYTRAVAVVRRGNP